VQRADGFETQAIFNEKVHDQPAGSGRGAIAIGSLGNRHEKPSDPLSVGADQSQPPVKSWIVFSCRLLPGPPAREHACHSYGLLCFIAGYVGIARDLAGSRTDMAVQTPLPSIPEPWQTGRLHGGVNGAAASAPWRPRTARARAC
jgi:hypothetical protein